MIKLNRREKVCVDCNYRRDLFRGCFYYCAHPGNVQNVKVKLCSVYVEGRPPYLSEQPLCVNVNDKGQCIYWEPELSWFDKLLIRFFGGEIVIQRIGE